MISHILFVVVTLAALGGLIWSFSRIFRIMGMLKKPYSISNAGERLGRLFKVAIGQNKIMRFPIIGFLHALVFWGFLIITIGSAEMLIDGLSGTPFDNNTMNDRILSVLGPVYDVIIAAGDIFALIIFIGIIIFLIRRWFLNISRFSGREMRHRDHKDAALALIMILILMVSLTGMNTGYISYAQSTGQDFHGVFPVSSFLADFFAGTSAESLHLLETINWWVHITVIFIFANYLPYSKHFHVFMSLPNVYLSRTEPLTKMNEMESVKKEVELMLNPEAEIPEEEGEPERFGMKDAEDGTWKNYLDSLACTQCGRCTSVCPANLTGKKLSPRKVVLDYRRRMEEKTEGLLKEGKSFSDGKSLFGDHTTAEELWACTTCNACAQECPVEIDHPSLILEMRRYIFLEESAAPTPVNSMNRNIENNGAPWQYSAADRFKWAENLKLSDGTPVNVPLMSEKFAKGEKPEYLFWVGSAGSFDERAVEITRSFAKVLHHAGVNYACPGTEETDSGDNAKRSGNEFLFQMQAFANIEMLKNYEVKKIVTCDPHDYNTLKNEYSDLGGEFEVIHHSELIEQLMQDGSLSICDSCFADKRFTYHDPCYLGRGNKVYDAPRELVKRFGELHEMKRNKSRALCCGAGGTQMFKEAEPGDKEVYELRTEDAMETKPDIIATSCPMCMTMMTDGIKMLNKSESTKVLDIAEIVAENLN